MISRKRALWASTALFGGMMVAGTAAAQSAGTETFEATSVEEVVVTGVRGPANIEGLAVVETVPRSRSTITQEYLETQVPGQTVLASINLLPGVTFSNTDAYGSSGGDITLRGFDAQRISLNIDGIQLNDTGNYQIYPNQQLDPELVERVAVNSGTTDVDSPTASATGGTINIVTRRPSVDPAFIVQQSFGSDNYRRSFFLAETGEFGPWGTRAWLAYSYTNYDQFFGPGELTKDQYNARIWQPIGLNGDYVSVAFHYNENRNNFYSTNNSVDTFNATGNFSATANSALCTQLAPVAGTRQDQGNNGLNPGCSNYYNVAINPSNTGNIRIQSRFTLTDSLTLTVDPTFQYVLANGGGITLVEETDQRLQGTFFNPLAPTATGVDLNGDGDLLDRIRLFSPSNTNTRRYSVNASLIWDVNDDHRVRFVYTWDRGNHRQTSEFGYLDLAGNPESPFGGKDGHGRVVLTRDGDFFQERNRQSIALLNQFAIEYAGSFYNDAVRLNLGLRAPFFERDLDNSCYQLNTFDAYCSRQVPATAPTAGAPIAFSREYDDLLPNVGVTWNFAPNQSLFFNYSENLSAPRTDDLYDRVPANPDPETSRNYDLGYRYSSGDLVISGSVFYSDFENFIVRAFETLPDLSTIAYSINAGDVTRWGADGQIGWQATDALSLYVSASYLDSEIQDNIPNTTGGTFATAGNQLAEVPEWQYAARAEYELGDFTFGLQAKYVDERWTNLVNDESTPDYTLVDFDARWDMDFINEGVYLQVNVQNLFDEEYLANISTSESGNRSASRGAPRSVVATLRVEF